MRLLLISNFLFISSLCIAQIKDFKSIDFTKADNIAKLNYNHNLKNLPQLAHKLTSKLDTDVEKFRAIYIWVCRNIRIDDNQGNKVLNKRKRLKNDSIAYKRWNDIYLKKSFSRLLKQKKAVCTGFAYLIKELCFLANIECEIINGFGRTATTNTEELNFANHSWNAVKLNNKWYLSDAIWASGYIDKGNFVKNYNDGYFLADPLLFATSHYPLKKEWLLNEKLEKSEFYASPIVYGETFIHKIIPEYPKNLISEVTKGKTVSFKINILGTNTIKKVKLVQFIGKKENTLNIEKLKIESDYITFNTKLKYKGWYDVHLKIHNDIVATYTFKVK